MNFQFTNVLRFVLPGILVSCSAKFIVRTQRENRQVENNIALILLCNFSLGNIFYLNDNHNHCLTEYMYDYYNYPQMFDEPSEYQDETSRAYDRAET